MRDLISCGTTIAVATLLAACTPSPSGSDAAPAASTPAASTPDAPAALEAFAGTTSAAVDDAALQAFLASVYGTQASLTDAWTQAPVQDSLRDTEATADAPENAKRQLCADQAITLDGQPARMVAVCGSPAQFGHPTPGLNDFFQLRMQDGKAVAIAQQHLQTFGSMGNPGEVKAMQLGADLWGFVVASGFSNMGYTANNWDLVLPKDGGFHEAGFLRSHISNLGTIETCEDENAPCTAPEAFNIDFALDTDRSNPAAAHWPLVVTESGQACGQPASATHRVLLDPATLRYQVPNLLKRETCKDDWTGD